MKNRKSSPQNRGKTGARRRTPPLGRRFEKGVSGNPGGRPKTRSLSVACRELLETVVPGDPHGLTYSQKIARRLAKSALRGSVSAAQELADRSEGRPHQAVQFSDGPDPLDQLLAEFNRQHDEAVRAGGPEEPN
ncbi:MAG TPA: DUF5681 domain-containing protein [Candidatus Acidoferrales bacterium]|nr:DUF5681 domain-containing protein [Candidatus Acidoferrales bacterium]